MEVFSAIKCEYKINSFTTIKDIYVTQVLLDYPKQMTYLYSCGYVKYFGKSYLMYLYASFCSKNTIENAKFLLYFILTGFRNLTTSRKWHFIINLEYRIASKHYYHLTGYDFYDELIMIIGNNCSLIEKFLYSKN